MLRQSQMESHTPKRALFSPFHLTLACEIVTPITLTALSHYYTIKPITLLLLLRYYTIKPITLLPLLRYYTIKPITLLHLLLHNGNSCHGNRCHVGQSYVRTGLMPVHIRRT